MLRRMVVLMGLLGLSTPALAVDGGIGGELDDGGPTRQRKAVHTGSSFGPRGTVPTAKREARKAGQPARKDSTPSTPSVDLNQQL